MSASNLSSAAAGRGMAEEEARRAGLKLAGLFLVVSAILVAGGSAYLFRQQKAAQLAAHRELSAISDLKLGQLTRWREERIADTRFFSRARFIARDLRQLMDNPGEHQALTSTLDWLTLLKGGDRYVGVAVFSPAGEVILALPKDTGEPPEHLGELMSEVRRRRDAVFSDLHRHENSQSIEMDLLFPVFEEGDWNQESPFCYVLLKIDARQFLFPVVDSWPTPSETAETLLIRREGDHVVYLNELKHRRGSALNHRLPLSTPHLPAAQVLSGTTQVLEGRDYRGVPVVSAGHVVPGTTWALVGKVDREEIYAPLRKQTLTAMAILGILLLAAAFLVAFLWRQRSTRFLQRELAERLEHERETQRLNRLYAALTYINQAVVRAKGSNELLEQICRALVDAGGCQMAWVGWSDCATGRITPRAQFGDTRGYLDRAQFFSREDPEIETFVGKAMRDGRPFVCNHVKDPAQPGACRSAGIQADWESLAAFPIKQEDQTVGVLAVYAGQRDFFGSQEQSLIGEAADDVSFGLEILENRKRRDRAEEALRRSEEQLRQATLAAELGVWNWTPGTSETVVSANWRRLFGVAGHEPVSLETWRGLLHPEDRDRVMAQLDSAVRGEQDYRSEYRIIRPDGVTRWILDRGRSFRDTSGHGLGMAGVNADITERKLSEEAVRQARDELARANAELERTVAQRTAQLVEANASLQAFAYTAAHDLRSPLRSIRSFSSLAKLQYGERLGTEGQSLLERVEVSAQQMDRLLHDLLDYSRMTQAELKLMPVDLKSAVAEALALLDTDMRAKAAIVSVADNLPGVIGHPATVVLLINNLISNAVKFVADGAPPQISIRAQRWEQNVRLHIEDKGIGISPEDLGKIFAPFERLHGRHEYPGTGLGLAIVSKGAERMRGKVGVESEPGKGSRFWIELPAA